MTSTEKTRKVLLQRKWRLVRVYISGTRIGLSYGWFKVKGMVMGPSWKARKRARLHMRNAKRAEKTILQVKGLFVKLGQLLSILTNFLPESFRKGLQGVQDQVPPRPLDTIVGSFRRDFGKTPDELFEHFDPNPIASASLAQVHKARLFDGTEVAVKVQHHDIEAIADLDLRTFRRILRVVAFFLKLRGLDHAFLQIRAMIMEELDFTREAHHLKTVTENFTGVDGIAFPKPIEGFCSRSILTTSFESGHKITDYAPRTAADVSRQDVAQRVLDAYCKMLFEHGVFHADPHPGNILVREDGTVVFLDFGAIGLLSDRMMAGIPKFLEAVLRHDEEQLGQVLVDMGFINIQEDEGTLRRIVAYFQRRFLENFPVEQLQLKDIHVDVKTKMEVFAELKDLDVSITDLMRLFQVPKDWVLLHRTLLLLTGLVSHIDPDMNPMHTIRPYLKGAISQGKQDWKALAVNIIRDMFANAITLPGDMKQWLEKANAGQWTVQIDGYRERTRTLRLAGQRLMLSMFTIASSFFAYMAFEDGHGDIANIAATVGGVSALALLLSFILGRR